MNFRWQSLAAFVTGRPLFSLAVLGVSLIAVYDWWSVGLWVGCVLSLLVGWVSGGWKGAAVAGFFGVVVIGKVYVGDRKQMVDEERFSMLGNAFAEGRLLEDAGEAGDLWSGRARLHGEEYAGAVVQWVGWGEPPVAGTELAAEGVFRGFKVARNPGTQDQAARMRTERVVAVFAASEMRSRQWTGPVSRFGARLKVGFRKGILAGLDEEGEPAQVIKAVVLGEREDAPLGLIRHFRESGTLHVFTVSGMHVLMVGGLVWLFLRTMRVRRSWGIPVIIFSMFFYTWLVGNGPAALRSAWMGSVFLSSFLLKRRADLLNSLGAVLFVNLLWEPQMIRNPGVQLSYGVVAAIGLFSGFTGRLFSWISEREGLMPDSEMSGWAVFQYRGRRWLTNALAVSTAAWSGSLLLTAFHFKLITPVSVIATVVLGFQVYVVLGMAVVAALVHPFFPSGAVVLNRVNAQVAAMSSGSAQFFSELPGAWWKVENTEGESLIVYDLDYGASAACFVGGGGNAVLLDCGGEFGLKSVVAPSLRNLGVSPDAVVFTHEDAGHAVGPEVLNQMFRIRQAAMVFPDRGSSVFSGWEVLRDEVKVVWPQAGDLLDLGGGVSAEVLLSPVDERLGSLADDRTLILKISWKGWRILWLGDGGRLSEEALLSSGLDLRADLVVAGLNENDLSLTKPFLKAVDPMAILISRPGASPMERFREQQKEKWERVGIEVIDQSQAGGVTISVEAEELVLEGFLDGSEVALGRR